MSRAGAIACGMALHFVVSFAHGEPLVLSGHQVVDLSHPFGPETLYWPTDPHRFELNSLSRGITPGGWFYAANALCTPEHGGTHLDAPLHFGAGGLATADIPVAQLVGPAVVIDVAERAAVDRDHRLSVAEVLADEARHGPIARGSIVLLRTGWSSRWPDARRYLGDDTPGDASNLHFPSFGAEAAKLLVVDRGAIVLGVDTASIDYGASRDFPVHRLAAAHQVPGLENLALLEALPARGAVVIALPMKIEGGSGGPLRAIAFLPSE